MSDWFKDGLCTTSTFIVTSKIVFLIWLEGWERIYWKGSGRKYMKTWCRVYKKITEESSNSVFSLLRWTFYGYKQSKVNWKSSRNQEPCEIRTEGLRRLSSFWNLVLLHLFQQESKTSLGDGTEVSKDWSETSRVVFQVLERAWNFVNWFRSIKFAYWFCLDVVYAHVCPGFEHRRLRWAQLLMV